jgi:hypothetical protein
MTGFPLRSNTQIYTDYFLFFTPTALETQPPASPSCKVYELEAVGPTPQREHTEVKSFFMLQTLGNGDFFPETKSYAVVHVVDESGFEAV